MNLAYLLIGGNVGEREQNLKLARELIANNCGEIVLQSSIYETEAWGKTDQPSFLNQVLAIKTGMFPADLLHCLLETEKTMGRLRTSKFGPRTIDIDILFYNDAIIDEDGLNIPHPRMQQRKFVLAPLQEIAPDLMHPLLQKSISQLLEECADPLTVKKL